MLSPVMVITRPPERARELSARCTDLGWDVLLMPPLLLEPLPDAQARLRHPETLAGVDTVFFISPSAVAFAATAFPWHTFSGSLVATGAATAAQIGLHTRQAVVYPRHGEDSEAVLTLPVWEHSRRVLIVGGEGGRPFLTEHLRQRGIEVHKAALYTRQEAPLNWALLDKALAQKRHTVVLVTSVEIARTWCKNIPQTLHPNVKSLLYLSTHPRISRELTAHGIARIQEINMGDNRLWAILENLKSHDRPFPT